MPIHSNIINPDLTAYYSNSCQPFGLAIGPDGAILSQAGPGEVLSSYGWANPAASVCKNVHDFSLTASASLDDFCANLQDGAYSRAESFTSTSANNKTDYFSVAQISENCIFPEETNVIIRLNDFLPNFEQPTGFSANYHATIFSGRGIVASPDGFAELDFWCENNPTHDLCYLPELTTAQPTQTPHSGAETKASQLIIGASIAAGLIGQFV